MNQHFATRQSLSSTRVIAVAAALLVFALSVFAASPVLHAWLHAHGADAAPLATKVGDHAGPDQAKHDQEQDDDCAVVLFAQGILPVILAFVLSGAFRRMVKFSVVYVAAIHRATPRYWLPPLCGPPLN